MHEALFLCERVLLCGLVAGAEALEEIPESGDRPGDCHIADVRMTGEE
jgi:hypothetical protein